MCVTQWRFPLEDFICRNTNRVRKVSLRESASALSPCGANEPVLMAKAQTDSRYKEAEEERSPGCKAK